VDLIVKVTEQATGSFTAAIGYSQLDGVSFNLGVSERNFIGSGNKLDLKVATSSAKKTLDIGVTDPYFTDDGVSLGTSIYLSEIDASELDVADYTTNNLGLRFSLGYPLNETDDIRYGLKFDSQDLVCSSAFVPCSDYISSYGKSATSIQMSVGWVHNSTNAFYFPSAGHKTTISAEAVLPGSSDTPFYKLHANESWYASLSDNFTLKLKAGVAYGAGYGKINALPFYENFYAGGIGSVRGFEPNSLGERYDLTTDGSDSPKGGALKTVGTAALVFPVPFVEDSSNVRLSWFFDFGNVFTDFDQFDVGELRSATGLGLSWITPMGPLTFSLAQPLAHSSTDKTQTFQFTLGTGF
jgi:outer membrane protein insertion porin family